jgi:hypothetical protein
MTLYRSDAVDERPFSSIIDVEDGTPRVFDYLSHHVHVKQAFRAQLYSVSYLR